MLEGPAIISNKPKLGLSNVTSYHCPSGCAAAAPRGLRSPATSVPIHLHGPLRSRLILQRVTSLAVWLPFPPLLPCLPFPLFLPFLPILPLLPLLALLPLLPFLPFLPFLPCLSCLHITSQVRVRVTEQLQRVRLGRS